MGSKMGRRRRLFIARYDFLMKRNILALFCRFIVLFGAVLMRFSELLGIKNTFFDAFP